MGQMPLNGGLNQSTNNIGQLVGPPLQSVTAPAPVTAPATAPGLASGPSSAELEARKCIESCRESCTKKKEAFINTDNCNIYIIAIIIISSFFLYDKYYKK